MAEVFSVTELNKLIKNKLETSFPVVIVEGEVSDLKIAASGHIYFSLKDEESVISAVFFRGFAENSKVELKNGLLVRVFAEVTCYIKQGRYQLIVRRAESKEEGALHIKFEQLKAKLEKEGLFSAARKKPIPPFPEVIGIATSEKGAAIRDILSILKRRSPNLHIIIAPCAVQGESAKHEIAEAIDALNKAKPRPDVILVGRGGGSAQDLWAFNEEITVRAIAGSKIPTISCVGHETDFTLTDFAADLRAPTPSAAAEIVVKNRADLISKLNSLKNNLLQSITIYYHRLYGRFQRVALSGFFAKPETIWQERAQTLDSAATALDSAVNARLKEFCRRADLPIHKLSALNPVGILKRGYSIARSPLTGKIIKVSSDCQTDSPVDLQLYKGMLKCRVEEVK